MVTLANPRTRDIDLYVNSYGTAMRFLRGKSQRKLANNTFVRQEDESSVSVVLHRTPIVTYYSTGLIVLRSGGYQTKTTAQRINQLLPPGWKLSRWKLTAPDGEKQDFFDGIAIHAGLRTHGEGSRRLPIRSKANLTEEEHAHLLSLSRQMTPPKYPGHQPNPPKKDKLIGYLNSDKEGTPLTNWDGGITDWRVYSTVANWRDAEGNRVKVLVLKKGTGKTASYAGGLWLNDKGTLFRGDIFGRINELMYRAEGVEDRAVAVAEYWANIDAEEEERDAQGGEEEE